MSKWIKRKPHISLEFIKIDQEAIVEVDSKIFSPAISLLADTETELEGIITIDITDPTLEIDPETITDVTTEEIITGPIERCNNYRQDNRRRDSHRQDNRNRQNYRGNLYDSRQRDRTESRDGLRNYINDSTQGKDSSDRDGWMQPRSRNLSHDRGGSRCRSNSRVNTNRDRLRCYRCGEYDHFTQECPNTPTDDEMGHSDSEQASLQMLTQDSLPLNSNGEVEYLNL